MSQLLLFAFLAMCCLCSQFYESEYTRITSVLTEVLFASSDETQQSKSCVERIEFALQEISIKYPFTEPLLVNIILLSCSEIYSIFVNNHNKEIFFSIRSPQLVKQVQQQKQTRTNDQSPTRYFEDPNKFSNINEIIINEVIEYTNEGYQTIFFGHSLGGTVSLLACIDNMWINHCEIHNPYLDATMFNILNRRIETSRIGKKTFISFTDGDPISTLGSSLSFSTLQSRIPNPSIIIPNAPNLLAHSSMTLFVELFFKNQSEKAAILLSLSPKLSNEDDIAAFKKYSKQNFESIIKSMKLDKESKIRYWYKQYQIHCPPFRICGSILGPKMCFQGMIVEDQICIRCRNGTFSFKIGQETCTDCPEGHYCQANNQPPTPAPPGSFQPFSRQTMYFDCEPGTYNTKFAQTKCQSCPIGHSCPLADQDPIPCPAGYYQPNLNQTSCLKCEAGTYAIKEGQQICESCPVGSYCPNTEESPIACPSNKCCLTINSTSFEERSNSSYSKLRFLEVKNSSKQY